MFNYLKAELYRYTHKKSTYVYYGIILIILAIVFTVAYVNNVTPKGMVENFGLGMFPQMLPVFIGIPIYLTIYNDDLSTKNVGNIITAGTSRLAFLITKFIAAMIVLLAGFALMVLVFFIAYFIMFRSFSEINSTQLTMLFESAIVRYLTTLAFFAITNIISFTFQKSSISLILAVLLPIGFIAQLISLVTLISSNLKFLLENTLTMHTDAAANSIIANNGIPTSFFIAIAAYILISFALTFISFRNRDIEVN